MPTTSSAPPPAFAVSMVKRAGSLRMAVINGASVREGDEVDGARVVAIGREAVELEYRGERLSVPTPTAGNAKVRRSNSP